MAWPSNGLSPAVPLKRAVVALTATGDVVAAVTGKRIKVYQFELQSETDGMTAQFKDGTGGSVLGIPWKINAREGAMSSPVPARSLRDELLYLFATTAGSALRAVLTGTGTVNIAVSYWDADES